MWNRSVCVITSVANLQLQGAALFLLLNPEPESYKFLNFAVSNPQGISRAEPEPKYFSNLELLRRMKQNRHCTGISNDVNFEICLYGIRNHF
jgi:hypothetical protein